MSSNFKLSKQDLDRRTSLVAALNKATGEIDRAVAAYNATLTQEWQLVRQAIDDYNVVLEDARAFAGDIGREAEENFDSKTETWQDSENGDAAATFRDEWQEIDLDNIPADQPDDYEFDKPTHAEDLDMLPVELEV